MKILSLPFLIVLFIAGALVHKGLAKKSNSLLPHSLSKPTAVTPESSNLSKVQPVANQTRFSFHKIASGSAIYYELHLENNGIIETWKINKGPSCNPLQKRSALKKSTIPAEYMLFEGVISKKNLYKETVLVWDYGTYIHTKPPTEKEYTLIFYGKRMQGAYTLSKEQNNWFLTKLDDEFADTHKNSTRMFTRSVISNRTITQILRTNNKEKS